MLPIAELFGQCDHNALGAAEVTESVHVLVLRNFANKFGPVLLQASNDVINVRDGEHDAAYAQRVHRYIRFSADCRWFLKLAQFKSAMAIRSPHHDYVASNAVEPDDTINPLPLNGRLAFEFQAKFDKERNGSLEIFDNKTGKTSLLLTDPAPLPEELPRPGSRPASQPETQTKPR